MDKHHYTAADNELAIKRGREEEERHRNRELDAKQWFEFQKSLEREEYCSDRRIMRGVARRKMDMEYEESIAKACREKAIREQQEKQEEALAEELKRIKLEKERDEKMRLQIRETSMELRELDSMLRTAYTNKERLAQISEKKADKLNEKSRDLEAVRVMTAKREREEQEERRKEVAHYHEMKKYSEGLRRQIQEHVSQVGAEDYLKDKMMVDEIVRKIYAEDMKDHERKRLNRQAIYQQMLRDQQESLVKHQREHERVVMEDEHIAKCGRELILRDEQRKAAKANHEEKRERVQREIGSKIAAKDDYERELNELRLELSAEQRLQKERARELVEEEKKRRMCAELKDSMSEANKLRDKKLEEEKQYEDFYTQKVLEKYAEENRIERAKLEKRHAMKLQQRKHADQQSSERQYNEQLRREREIEDMNEQKRLSEFQRKIIEEERQKMLLQHGPCLLGHLPKGVIRDEKDLQLLGEKFRHAYAKPTNDPFAQSRVII